MVEYRILINKLYQSEIIEANTPEEAYELFNERKPKTFEVKDAEFPYDVVEIGINDPEKPIIRIDSSRTNPKNGSHNLVNFRVITQMEGHPQFKESTKQLEIEYNFLRDVKYPYSDDMDKRDIPVEEVFDLIEKYAKIVEPENLRDTWIKYQKEHPEKFRQLH